MRAGALARSLASLACLEATSQLLSLRTTESGAVRLGRDLGIRRGAGGEGVARVCPDHLEVS